MSWRPIETAPKDGTWIDVWVHSNPHEGYRITNAYWVDSSADGPGWYAEYQDYLDSGKIDATVTHWMPQPEPPQ